MRTIHSKTALSVLLLLATLMGAETLFAQRVQVLGATNSLWKYRANPTDPGFIPADAWVAPAFDDSTSFNGPGRGLFGTESAGVYPYPINTPVPSPSGGGGVSHYYRAHFTWTNEPMGVTLEFTNYVDDGILVYLNGVELFAWNVPADRPLPYNTSTLPGAANPGGEPVTLRTNVIANLVSGDNVIAVQLQQHGTGSSDAVFGMWMFATIPFAPTNLNLTQPTNRVVVENRSTVLTMFADGGPPPTYQWYKDGVAIDPSVNPTATNASLVITRMAATDAGNYHAVATNPAGSATSRTATVGFIEDEAAPLLVGAVGSPAFNQVTVEFDESMDPMTVTDAVNYAISPTLVVSAATLSPDGKAVILTTDAQAPNTVYTVTVSDVFDLASNPLAGAPNNTVQFRSWVNSACSGVLFEAFSSTGTTIPLFTNSPTYPNSPFTNALISRMHSRAIFPDNSNENYGGRMRALFIPLVSGNWRFYMSSDDPGELWFNPNGTSPAGRQLIARELACCQLYRPTGFPQTSEAFPLVAGQGYYIELIYKENTGGDYGMVAARLDGTGVPTGGNDQGAEAGEAISGAVAPSPFCTVGFGAVPAGVAGTLTINQNLSNVSTEANRRVTLTLGASAPTAPYVCYQWQKSDDGGATFNNIPGANRATYTTPYLTVADDNQDVYRVIAGIPGVDLTSANAVITVTADVTRPTVTRVIGIDSTHIAVFFSEPMTGSSSAEDAFSYLMDQGITVTTALVNTNNPLRVDLTVDPAMTLDTIYQLTLSTVSTTLTDPSGNPVNPDPTIVTFRAQNYPGNADTLITLPTNTKLAPGALTERGIDVRFVQVAVVVRPPLLPTAEDMLAGTLIDPTTMQPAVNIAPIPTYVETEAINYGDTPAGAGTGRLLPDKPFPGYTNAQDNMAFEARAYLQLQRGVYRMGVNSDDDFQVTPALSVSDPNNAIVLGSFSGGRGVADSTFDFYVPEDGLYPFRLIWIEYQGGAAGEWWTQSLSDSSFAGINGTGGIPAFRAVATTPRLTITPTGGGNATVTWTSSDSAFVLQGSANLESPSWSAVGGVSNVGNNYTATVSIASGKRFFRLQKP
jgi:hypothetical protein